MLRGRIGDLDNAGNMLVVLFNQRRAVAVAISGIDMMEDRSEPTRRDKIVAVAERLLIATALLRGDNKLFDIVDRCQKRPKVKRTSRSTR